MSALAIDIGGTKFTVAVAEENRIVRRVVRATNREGGRKWLLG